MKNYSYIGRKIDNYKNLDVKIYKNKETVKH